MSPRLAGALAMAFLTVACGNHGDHSGSQVGPSPVVLTDTSPKELAVTVAINMGGYEAATRDKTLIDIFFQHGGRPVRFVAGEGVTCGAVRLKWSFKAEFVTSAVAGKPIICLYTSAHASAPITFQIPHALAILTPRDHEQVQTGAKTVVTYGGVTDSNTWVVALGSNSKAVARPENVTSAGATLDTTALGSGEGSIALTDPNNFPLAAIQAPKFQSVQGSARRMTMVAVTWVTMHP